MWTATLYNLLVNRGHAHLAQGQPGGEDREPVATLGAALAGATLQLETLEAYVLE